MNLTKKRFSMSMEELFYSSLISDTRKEILIEDFMLLLEKKIHQYTGGDSSLSKEKAQMIMESIDKTLVFYLQQYDEQYVISLLYQHNIQELYFQSAQYLLHSLHQLYLQTLHLQKQILPIPVDIYQKTLRNGLSAFFQAYNYEYHFSDLIITFDYPTCHPLKQKDLNKMMEYIHNLEIEHMFLHTFDIQNIIYCFQHFYYYDIYMIENISGMIFIQFLCMSFLSPHSLSLQMNTQDGQKLYCLFQHINKEELYDMLLQQWKFLIQYFHFHELVEDYYQRYIKEVHSQLYQALQFHTLDKLLSFHQQKESL